MNVLYLRLAFPIIMTLLGLYLLVSYFQNPAPAPDALQKALLATGVGLAWIVFRLVRWKKGNP